MCYEQAACDWKAVFHARQACKWAPVCSAGKLLCQCQCVRADDGISWIKTCGFYFCDAAGDIGTYRRDSLLKNGSIFPFTSSCSYLVALHFSFGHAASVSEFFKLVAKIHQRILKVCVLSSLQPLSEAQRASTLRLVARKKKKKLFLAALQL